MHLSFYCFERAFQAPAQAEAGEFSELKCRGGLSPGDQDSWRRQDRAPERESRGEEETPGSSPHGPNTGQRTQVGKLYKAGEGIPAVIREVTMIMHCPWKSEAVMGNAQGCSTDDKSPDFIPGLKKKKSVLWSCVFFLFKVVKVLQTRRERKYPESVHHLARSLLTRQSWLSVHLKGSSETWKEPPFKNASLLCIS